MSQFLKSKTVKSPKNDLQNTQNAQNNGAYSVFSEANLEHELSSFVEENFEVVVGVMDQGKNLTVKRLLDIFEIPYHQQEIISDFYKKKGFTASESVLAAFILKNTLLREGFLLFLPTNKYLSKKDFNLYLYALEHSFLEVKEFNLFEALLWHCKEVSQDFFYNLEALKAEFGSLRKLTNVISNETEVIRTIFYAYSGQRLNKNLSEFSPLIADQLGFVTTKPQDDFKRFQSQGRKRLADLVDTATEENLPFKVSKITLPYLEGDQLIINSEWFKPEKYLQELETTITQILEKKAINKYT